MFHERRIRWTINPDYHMVVVSYSFIVYYEVIYDESLKKFGRTLISNSDKELTSNFVKFILYNKYKFKVWQRIKHSSSNTLRKICPKEVLSCLTRKPGVNDEVRKQINTIASDILTGKFEETMPKH